MYFNCCSTLWEELSFHPTSGGILMHTLICCAVTGTQITTLNIDYANDMNVLLVDVFCSYSQKSNLFGIN